MLKKFRRSSFLMLHPAVQGVRRNGGREGAYGPGPYRISFLASTVSNKGQSNMRLKHTSVEAAAMSMDKAIYICMADVGVGMSSPIACIM